MGPRELLKLELLPSVLDVLLHALGLLDNDPSKVRRSNRSATSSLKRFMEALTIDVAS